MALPGDSYWVVVSRLLAGPYPGDPDRGAKRRKLAALLDLGVRHFVDLTEEGEHPPYGPDVAELASGRGVEISHQRFPIPDIGLPAPGEMGEILAAIDADLDRGEPVYVHCRGGVGRTGTVVGCWLVEQGLDPESALARLAEIREGTRHADWEAPETPAQREFILDWPRPGGG